VKLPRRFIRFRYLLLQGRYRAGAAPRSGDIRRLKQSNSPAGHRLLSYARKRIRQCLNDRIRSLHRRCSKVNLRMIPLTHSPSLSFIEKNSARGSLLRSMVQHSGGIREMCARFSSPPQAPFVGGWSSRSEAGLPPHPNQRKRPARDRR
jgi:hypothetical protein